MAGQPQGSTLDAELRELLTRTHLTHLNDALVTKTLVGLEVDLHSAGRPGFLSRLKEIGISTLGARQALANAVSRSARERATRAASTQSHSIERTLSPSVALAGDTSSSKPPTMPLIYELIQPTEKPSSTPPLVVFLHGSGATERDLLPLAQGISEACGGALVASLRGPYSQMGGYAWFHGNSAAPPREALDEEIGRSTDSLMQFLEVAPLRLGTDPRAAFVFGFSQGATIGWTLALSGWSRANLLAGLVLVSGRAMPECLQSSSALGKRLVSRGELSRRPPVLAAHGERDGVTPLSFGQQSAALGRKAGLNVDYIEHEGGHEVPNDLVGAAHKYLRTSLSRLAVRSAAVAMATPLDKPSMATPPGSIAPVAIDTARDDPVEKPPGTSLCKPSTNLNYAKWDNIDSDDEADRDRQRERRIAERKAKGVLTETERFEAAARFSQGTQPVDTQKEQMQATIRDFDPAGHQKDRIAHLEGMKRMSNNSGERMDQIELHNEQILRDAKQQGRQGNVVFGKNGKVEILDDDRMGGKADLYWWGQNNTEVTIKCHVSQGVRSKAVQLSAASHTVKLVVDGKVVCHGPTCEPILPDESTFVLEDTPNGRLLTVTLVKAKETSGNEHWSCAIKGEATIDASKFGVPVKTINPFDPTALQRALDK